VPAIERDASIDFPHGEEGFGQSRSPSRTTYNGDATHFFARQQQEEAAMPTVPLIDEREAGAEARAVFDDIKASRNTDWINNFWRALANHPPTLKRTWESLKEVMAAGALDPLTKELVYLAVSISNGCQYCTASHGAAAKRLGMSPEMLGELVAVVGMANETNRLADGYRVPVDERFENLF
jgi:AhpD family alkylhydroperoxidase